MGCMFFGCSSLNSIDLTKFNTKCVTDNFDMFSGCSSLKTIYVCKNNINEFKKCVNKDLLKLK